MLLVLCVNHLYKVKRKQKVLWQCCRQLGSRRLILSQSQENEAIAREYGCLPPPRLQNQRPLGLDRLEQIFRAESEPRLMELFLFHFRQTGYTLKQVFLLIPAFGTVDPANLKAMLSSKFSGRAQESGIY